MILKLLTFLFESLIGRLPENKRKELADKFTDLLTEVVKASAEGAIKGMAKEK